MVKLNKTRTRYVRTGGSKNKKQKTKNKKHKEDILFDLCNKKHCAIDPLIAAQYEKEYKAEEAIKCPKSLEKTKKLYKCQFNAYDESKFGKLNKKNIECYKTYCAKEQRDRVQAFMKRNPYPEEIRAMNPNNNWAFLGAMMGDIF